MNGSGCKNCPVNPCETINYRGSTCAAQRAKYGLGDPMSNAERIRSMTDEEFAKFIDDKCVCPPASECPEVCGDCYACWLEWLQQPAETPMEELEENV